MVLHFQDNRETPASPLRLLWTSGCRKRSGQETQSGCKTKTDKALSKTFILYIFCCCPCFPWGMGGEGSAFTNTAPIDSLPRSCTGQTWPSSAHLWIMDSPSCNFMKPLDKTLCTGRCSRGKVRQECHGKRKNGRFFTRLLEFHIEFHILSSELQLLHQEPLPWDPGHGTGTGKDRR